MGIERFRGAKASCRVVRRVLQRGGFDGVVVAQGLGGKVGVTVGGGEGAYEMLGRIAEALQVRAGLDVRLNLDGVQVLGAGAI